MGPSTFVDGDRLLDAEALQIKMLQWGHRLSSTETIVGPEAAARVVRLQWGHRLSSTETGRDDTVLVDVLGASMGPSTFVDGDFRQPPS